jgi:hypothetical protein
VLIKRIVGVMASDWMVTDPGGVSCLFSVDYFGSHSFTGYRGEGVRAGQDRERDAGTRKAARWSSKARAVERSVCRLSRMRRE